jgi:hypothetical protein
LLVRKPKLVNADKQAPPLGFSGIANEDKVSENVSAVAGQNNSKPENK